MNNFRRSAFILISLLGCPMLFRAQTQNMNRPAQVAGSFYPEDPQDLAAMIDEFLKEAPNKPHDGNLVAILVPHAGYVYSGPVAAAGYKNIGKGWETVVLLGPAHRVPVRGAAVWSKGSFNTPLGAVPIDEELANEFRLACPAIEAAGEPHENEHSLEVQIPFLQRVLGNFKIVPLLLNNENDLDQLKNIGQAIASAIRGKKILLVISSDLSHYPTSATARQVDETTLLSLERLDPLYFHKTAQTLMEHGENNLLCTLCGEAALLAGLTAARELGANTDMIFSYLNSGEREGVREKNRAVGYGAVAFLKKETPAVISSNLKKEESKSILLTEARQTIKEGLEGKSYAPTLFSTQAELNLPAAVFVTLTSGGRLRGCIGTTEPHSTLLEAVRIYARAATFEDSRFRPLKKEELNDLHIEISILSPMTPIPNAEAIQPHKHGVTVEKGSHRGLFLPTVWEQLPDKEEFMNELCSQKAGLPADCWKKPGVTLNIFTTEIIEEPKRK
jgi:MEMO1 family protein